MVVMFLVLHNDYHDGHQRRDVDSPSSEYLIIMKTYSSGLYDDFDDDYDDDIYIMMKCVCVCLSVTKNHHFPLPSWAPEARIEQPARPCRS